MKYLFNWILLILILLSFGYTVFIELTNEKTAYVNINELYSEFTLKKDLELQLTSIQNNRQNLLDSLKLDLNSLARIITNNNLTPKDTSNELVKQFYLKKQWYHNKSDKFIEQNEILAQEYNSQVLKQLTQYVEDYGRVKHYTFIYGATGEGNLMYADKSKNISKEVIEFINNKYNGTN